MDINNIMQSVALEKELKDISNETNETLVKIQAYVSLIDIVCRENRTDKDFIEYMQDKQAILLRLVNRLNDIAMHAMAINEQSIYYKCEDKKREVRELMETVRNLYM